MTQVVTALEAAVSLQGDELSALAVKEVTGHDHHPRDRSLNRGDEMRNGWRDE